MGDLSLEVGKSVGIYHAKGALSYLVGESVVFKRCFCHIQRVFVILSEAKYLKNNPKKYANRDISLSLKYDKVQCDKTNKI